MYFSPPGQSWASRNANKRGPRLALPGLGGGIPELFTQSSNGKHEIEGTEVAPSDPDRFGDAYIYVETEQIRKRPNAPMRIHSPPPYLFEPPPRNWGDVSGGSKGPSGPEGGGHCSKFEREHQK